MTCCDNWHRTPLGGMLVDWHGASIFGVCCGATAAVTSVIAESSEYSSGQPLGGTNLCDFCKTKDETARTSFFSTLQHRLTGLGAPY